MEPSLSISEPSVAKDAVKDVTVANFKADVLEASRQALVVVVFWTPRDSLCKQMAAALEKVARASKGAVKLAKIDIDRDQTIAQQMGVSSAPSVFAFHAGRPLDAFTGGMPDAQIKTWIDQLLKTTGVGGAETAGLETAFKQAADFLEKGDAQMARAIYADIFEMSPENAKAYAGLVRCLMEEGETAKAREKLDTAPAAIAKDKALDSVRAAIELAEQTGQSKGQLEKLEAALAQNPADPQTKFDLALAYYAAGRHEEAVDQLLDIIRVARKWNDDGARKQLVKFFEAFGATNPLTIAARKRLSSILFS
ncbi:MAG: tetratricopeptide repeat protein [Bdellovibrionales bacterium]